MTVNNEIRYAIDYHEATKHSEASLMTSRHYLDFNNKPIPFKIYLELPSITLPISFPTPEVNALSCISGMISQRSHHDTNGFTTTTKTSRNSNNSSNTPELDAENLAEILFFSAGITREMKYPYGNYYMRAASATGALYPIELYVVCDDISSDLVAGVYHFSPADFSLTQVRKGTFKRYLAAAANNQDIANSAITVVFTSLAWRNAWKYQARSYRHWFWDSGVIAANLLATTYAIRLPTRIITGFLDDNVSQLLCLEDQREAAIAMAAIGSGSSKDIIAPSQQENEVDRLSFLPIPKIRALSKRGEVNYPEIWELNQASKLTSKQEIEGWISNAHRHHQLLSAASHRSQDRGTDSDNIIITPNELEEGIKNSHSLKETILWRGSSRRFARSNISLSNLKTILYNSSRGVPMDIFRDGNSLLDIYFIANGVDGLTPGAYFYNRNGSATSSNTSIEKIREIASSRNISSYLCLGQSLFRDASVVFFLMTDLQAVLRSLGNRGYRASQFEAGIIAGKIYLAAYALGIGASGSTFFDDAVTEAFSPHASNKSTMIAVGVGVPPYKASPGKVLSTRLSKEQLFTQDFT
ncbi:MAG: SagB/ThcOx family dehydrogenase [Thermoproteota archaeon]|nr:SagB/ThcOx family dehydrogenase [Thermoproteota archaeon]